MEINGKCGNTKNAELYAGAPVASGL